MDRRSSTTVSGGRPTSQDDPSLLLALLRWVLDSVENAGRSAATALTFVCLSLFLLLWFSKSVTAQSAEAAAQIHVILDGSVVEKPVSGRLLVLFSKKSNPAPMMGPDWFSPEPFVALYVRDAQPGQNILVTDAADGFPSRLSTLPPGRYFVQAVLNRNPEFSNHKDGPGNLYSPIASVVVRSNQPVSATLRLNSKIEPTNYNETHLARVFSRRSKLLSDFHHREVKDRALVLLPPSYVSNPDKRYPVYYEITGFGATIKDLLGYHKQSEVAAGGVEFIHVMLTGQCQWGHHVYADSATNGPRSAALVEELIPAIDREFRTIAKPEARFLGGHSSGGWASLWLQIKHPTKFAGVWSTAPDPVDFRDWQGTNLYEADANVYRTVSGDRKPLARHGTRTLLWYDEFTKMDDVLGRGGQIRSFDAVFSPLETTGAPARCWNRQSGAVNQEIAEAWKQFDISRILLENWEALKGPLEGKIHVFMGTDDTFLLTRAAELLAERLDELGSDAQFEFIQGRNHFDLVDPLTRDRIHREIAERFLKTN